MVAKPQRHDATNAADWLESELLATKARLHKVEGELQQALKQTWSLEADIRRVNEAVSVSGSVSAALSSFREDLRQLQAQLGKAQDRQAALTNRVEEVVRQRNTEGGRDRQDMAVMVKQAESASKVVQQFENRTQALEEATRRLEEDLAARQLAHHGLERSIEDAAARSVRGIDAAARLEQELTRAALQFEELHKTDGALDERVNLAQELLRRTQERLDSVEKLAAFPDEARELLKRAVFEREQLAQRLAVVEKLAKEVHDRFQEFVHGLARLDQRSLNQGAELVSLSSRLQELEDNTRSNFKRLFQVQLRQRRRQSESLAQEIKELSQGEFGRDG